MKRSVLATLILFAASVAVSAQEAEENRSLGDVARETREHVKADAQNPSAHSARVLEIVADISVNTAEDYTGHITELINQKDFAGLEKAADSARSNKSRLPGGTWKLYDFYDTISKPWNGSAASEADWNTHMSFLKDWVSRQPQSTTAHIALAAAYLKYGYKVRGNGHADTVSEEGWHALGDGANSALKELQEAATLPVRCPYWYAAMMDVALAQGWSRARARELVEQSISYEPEFYHVYRLYANYLEPKWYGNEGEAEAFAEEISRRLGGREGDFVYFEIGSVLNCAPCGTGSPGFKLSWSRIKDGYGAMEQMYGTSNSKMNRFAFMAVKAGDRATAKDIFTTIGDHWDNATWRRKQAFDAAREWVMQ
jgi:hypothetical protein